MAVGDGRWLRGVFKFLVNGDLALVDELEGFRQVTSAAAKCG